MNIDPSTTKYMIKALSLIHISEPTRRYAISYAVFRVGPCKAKINAELIEDVRISKRTRIIERARSLLGDLIKQSKSSGIDLTESVRQSVQMEEIIHYGKERLPAGPNVLESDAIIIVEGRSDVLNLLRSGIKNAIAVEGTNIPRVISDLSKERIITAFVDGDRGGELILRELFQVAEVDFVARAPKGQEVEELTQKQIMKCLRNKIPGEQFIEMYGLGGDSTQDEPGRRPLERNDRVERVKGVERHERLPRYERPEVTEGSEVQKVEEIKQPKRLSSTQEKYKEIINELSSTSKAKLMNSEGAVLKEVPVRGLVNTLKNDSKGISVIVFDGIVTQRILDIASEQKISTIVGTKMGNITKQPTSVEVWTKIDFN